MKIHHIQTGTVAIKETQRVGRGKTNLGRFFSMLINRDWTEDLPNAEIASRTLDRIRHWAREEEMIYLPGHDPQSARRLNQRIPVHVDNPEEEKLSA